MSWAVRRGGRPAAIEGEDLPFIPGEVADREAVVVPASGSRESSSMSWLLRGQWKGEPSSGRMTMPAAASSLARRSGESGTGPASR